MTRDYVQEMSAIWDESVKLETVLQLVEDAAGALNVRKKFRHSDMTNDFVGSEDDENAIDDAAADLVKAIILLKQVTGYK